MTRDELMAQCKYFKGQERCPRNCDIIFWMMEQNYVGCRGKEGSFADEYELYYQRYGEREYRGVPYGILSRLYIYALEKGLGYADTLEKFHEWIDAYIDYAPQH